MLENYPDMMSVEQMAQSLTIGLSSAYRLVHDKSVGSVRIGRKIVIPKQCVIEFVCEEICAGKHPQDGKEIEK